MDIKEKMLGGELYLPWDEELMKEQTACLDRLYDFNATRPTEGEKREKMLREMFAEIGEGCYLEPPFHANWGGRHVHFGKFVYGNFNLTLVDDADIYVGDYTMFGPNVTVASAGHPVLPDLREKLYQYNAPVHIGKNCWIGAGSVVTKNIPADVVAVGNPCRVLRSIGEKDREYYFKDKRIDWSEIEK